MRDGMPGRDPLEILAYVRKRTPGRETIQSIDRIALLLDEWIDAEDAALLRSLADRLRLIRTALRGKGRAEYAQEETRQMIAEALAAGRGAPFDA